MRVRTCTSCFSVMNKRDFKLVKLFGFAGVFRRVSVP